MLKLVIPPRDYTIETPEGDVLFKQTEGGTLLLEHSLISLSKWEMKYEKPFLNHGNNRTQEESLYYIKCMTLNKNVSNDVYSSITNEDIEKVNAYIDSRQSATWFNERNNNTFGRKRGEVVTSELIYYWMTALNIPVEFEKWHLNRLITLIKICEIKQQNPKKMATKDVYARNRQLNEARRKRSGSKG